MTEYRGMPAVKAMAEEFKNRAAALKEKGIYPKLAVVRVGEREDDIAYERSHPRYPLPVTDVQIPFQIHRLRLLRPQYCAYFHLHPRRTHSFTLLYFFSYTPLPAERIQSRDRLRAVIPEDHSILRPDPPEHPP